MYNFSLTNIAKTRSRVYSFLFKKPTLSEGVKEEPFLYPFHRDEHVLKSSYT